MMKKCSFNWNRRDFLRTGSSISAGLVSGFLPPVLGKYKPPVSVLLEDQMVHDKLNDSAKVRTILLAAIDAAMTAGAQYADARVTRTVYLEGTTDVEMLAIGVRTMADGAWGFASSPYWHIDEATILAQSAVQQAKANARVAPQEIELADCPVVNGEWFTPLTIDPFKISYEEKREFELSLNGLFPRRVQNRQFAFSFTSKFNRKEVVTATSDGSYFAQTFHDVGASMTVSVHRILEKDRRSAKAKGLGHVGGGWEHILNAKLREQIPELIEEAEEKFNIKEKPVDVGRYTVVCDAKTTARLIRGTLSEATQIDRVMGYEANNGGTSYLGPDPMEYLGKKLASPLLSVRADRTMPGGLATVRWDDEGVETSAFDIVRDGVLVNYQTTREQASWLTPWYNQQGEKAKSLACARVSSAINIPMQFSPNLVMTPGPDEVGFDELVASVSKGLALIDGETSMDFQSRAGMAGVRGEWREITDGKLGNIVNFAGMLFDSKEIWQTVQSIGGSTSQDVVSCREVKGEPVQTNLYTVSAVPAIFKEAAIINRTARG